MKRQNDFIIKFTKLRFTRKYANKNVAFLNVLSVLSRIVVSYWRKDVHLVKVNRLGSLPRLTDRLSMSTVVDWDVKSQIKQTNKLSRIVLVAAIDIFDGVSPFNVPLVLDSVVAKRKYKHLLSVICCT